LVDTLPASSCCTNTLCHIHIVPHGRKTELQAQLRAAITKRNQHEAGGNSSGTTTTSATAATAAAGTSAPTSALAVVAATSTKAAGADSTKSDAPALGESPVADVAENDASASAAAASAVPAAAVPVQSGFATPTAAQLLQLQQHETDAVGSTTAATNAASNAASGSAITVGPSHSVLSSSIQSIGLMRAAPVSVQQQQLQPQQQFTQQQVQTATGSGSSISAAAPVATAVSSAEVRVIVYHDTLCMRNVLDAVQAEQQRQSTLSQLYSTRTRRIVTTRQQNYD
jgi:hypothetical protein